jgi:hypothetical protein
VVSSQVEEAARTIEALTGVPSTIPEKKMARRETREQAARVRRFLSLPPQLQEGILRYGENIQKAYKT